MERLTYKFNTLSLANFAANAIKKDGVGVVVANNNSFVVVDTTDAEAATRIVESARGYEVMREAVGQPTKPVAITRPANPVVAKLVNYKVPMHMVRQYPILKKKKDSMPGSKIMWSHTSGDNDLDVIPAKDVEGYMRAGWVIIEQTGENEWEIQSLTEKTKLTPDQLKAANTSLRSKMIKKGAKKEEAELEEEQVDVQEGGVKAAIEDFMYDMLPKQAIAELKPIMKNQSVRGADLRNKVTAVLKKHKVPLMHLGGSSAQLVIDYFDTFHGESVEVTEAFIRQQQWATMRSNYKQGTPVNIVLKNGKTVSGTLLRMDKYDRGTTDQGHMLHVKTTGGNTKVEDVDVKSIYWNNDPKTKISEEVEQVDEATKTIQLGKATVKVDAGGRQFFNYPGMPASKRVPLMAFIAKAYGVSDKEVMTSPEAMKGFKMVAANLDDFNAWLKKNNMYSAFTGGMGYDGENLGWWLKNVKKKAIKGNWKKPQGIKEEVEVAEQFKAGDKVKVPHKGKMVSGKIVRFDSGGTDKARQHGGGYVVDVGEPASILVPKQKVQKEEVEIAENSWGGGFQSAADAHRQVQAGLKADFQRERAQKLKLIVQVIRGEISKQKFKKLTGSNYDELMKNSPYFRNQIKRMPKKALEPVAKAESVEIEEIYDGGKSRAAMQSNIKKAPTPKDKEELVKLDNAIKKSPKIYGISMDALGDLAPGETPSRKKLTPMAARAADGYDAKNTDRSVNLGIISKINKRIKEEVEEIEEAYAPLDTPNIIGAFTETSKKKRFEYRKSTNKWGISHGLPHEVCVKENSPSEWRSANVKGTVCYIATDEGEGGKPVLEKWTISNHVKYVKAEEIEHGGNGEIELDEAPMISPEAGLGIFGYSKPQFEAKMRQLIQKMGFEKGINRTEMSNGTMTLYFANRAKAQDFMVTFNGMVRRTASGIVAKLVPSAAMSSDQSKKAMGSEALVILDLNKMKKESAEFEAILQNLEEEVLDEKLIGKQKKLDVNNNDKLDAQDFKILRAKKAKKEEVEVTEAMSNYIAFYNGKKMPVQAETSYKAQLKAAEMLKVPASKRYMITVKLADNKAALAANEEVENIDELTVPQTHALAIARKTVKMNDVMAKVMGGMSKKDAHEFLLKNGTAAEKDAAKKFLGMKEEAEINEAAPAIKAGMRLYAKQDKKTDNGSVVKGQYYKVADAGGGLFNLIHQSTGYRKAMIKVTASAIQAMIQNKIF